MATIDLKDATIPFPFIVGTENFYALSEMVSLLSLLVCQMDFHAVPESSLKFSSLSRLIYINVATFQSVTLMTYISKAQHMTSV